MLHSLHYVELSVLNVRSTGQALEDDNWQDRLFLPAIQDESAW